MAIRYSAPIMTPSTIQKMLISVWEGPHRESRINTGNIIIRHYKDILLTIFHVN